MKIEEGKRYWKKNGSISGPIIQNNVSKRNGRVWFDLSTGVSYLRDGRVRNGDDEDREDLVAEYIDLDERVTMGLDVPNTQRRRAATLFSFALTPGGQILLGGLLGAIFMLASFIILWVTGVGGKQWQE